MSREDFNKQQLKEYKDAFLLFDSNDSGKITTSDLESILKTFGEQKPSPRELAMMIGEENKDGISFHQFLDMMAKKSVDEEEEQDSEKQMLQQTFKILDPNGTGGVDPNTLKDVLATFGQKLTDKEIGELLDEIDVDNMGRVTYGAFAGMLPSE